MRVRTASSFWIVFGYPISIYSPLLFLMDRRTNRRLQRPPFLDAEMDIRSTDLELPTPCSDGLRLPEGFDLLSVMSVAQCRSIPRSPFALGAAVRDLIRLPFMAAVFFMVTLALVPYGSDFLYQFIPPSIGAVCTG